MPKRLSVLLIICVGLLLAACSNESDDSRSASDHAQTNTEEYTEESSDAPISADDGESGQDVAAPEQPGNEADEESSASQADETTQSDRKIIYNANLRIEVKKYQQTVNDIQTDVAELGGYIVDSDMHEGDGEGTTTGRITARVPQEQFEDFIQTVEDGSSDVLNSSVSGQDVTEEYVDLESRLESKRVVEERLLSFMEEAEETEDLLKISDDLATVQQEIEEITGRMNYLDNKVDFATVTIHIEENNVSITSEEDLNTWEKTKQQFMKSINFLLSAFSGLFVFVAGGLPVLLVLGIIGTVVFWFIRRRKKNNQQHS